MTRPPRLRSCAAFLGLVAAPLLGAPTGAGAQDGEDGTLVEEARERQREFERFRESHIPVQPRRRQGCDEQIGRICVWFGGEDEAHFPRELDEVREARRELIRFLSDASERTADPWVLGQLVRYLVESNSLGEAERVARRCGLDEVWWCSALTGYVLHVRRQYVDAEEAFRDGLAVMPDDERARWLSPAHIFSPDQAREFAELEPRARLARWELFWRLSDPLFLVEGNDRLTDHFARLVEVKMREDAANAQPLEWDDDLEAVLIRYGRTIGYSRSHDPMGTIRRGTVTDTRVVSAHHHPKSRGYLFPAEFLESPAEVPPELWITAPREARTWYAPPYAPTIRRLETQVGRFRRGDEMLVVGAYRPRLPPPDTAEADVPGAPPEIQGQVHAALLLVPEPGGPVAFARSEQPAGVLELRARPGRYVASLEVTDLQEGRAWRARQGVVQRPLVRGLVGVSDLMILDEGVGPQESLEAAIPLIRPGVNVRSGESVTALWEVYGLDVQEPVAVTLGFTQGRPGFMARVGQFLGVLEPEDPVNVTFQDRGAEERGVQSVFRSVTLTLPDVEPGEYTLHLRLGLSGREPLVASRPIVVVGGAPD